MENKAHSSTDNKAGKNIVLEVRHLSVTFLQYDRGLRRREVNPVRDVNLAVEAGKITAVVGESGSGKSLLAHAILGLMPYNCHLSGEILYDREPLTENRLKKLRGTEITLVPQGVSYLDPLMKVGPQIRGGRKDGKAKEQSAGLLKRYGLDPETEKLYPSELSGGMARRVMIAASLMNRPRLVIADEPTPGLDLPTARRVMGHFREMAETGAGVFMITHDLELALETADQILIFKDGDVVETVSPEDFRQEDTLEHSFTKALFRAMTSHGSGTWRQEGKERM